MDERVFFTPGDIVQLRQDIPNRPTMIVKSIDKAAMKNGDKPMLFGITCIWFTTEGLIQKERFNTKDLIHVDDVK